VNTDFEGVFKEFVTGFGGEVLPETPGSKTADYLFRQQNTIAELKCLMEDQTDATDKKVKEMALEWIRKNGALPEYDGAYISIATAPKEMADEWLRILKAPIERVIGSANRQIRETKKHLNRPDALGLLFVFNQANPLHDHPKDFRLLLGEVLCKRDSTRQLRFPHIDGVVYFSFETVKSDPEQMSFWAPMQLRETLEQDVTAMQTFQRQLRDAWYAFVETHFGKKVRNTDID